MTTQADLAEPREQTTRWRKSRHGSLRVAAGAVFFLAAALLMAGCDSGGSDNEAPSASYTATANEEDPTTYTFDASASSDPDGQIAAYEWDYDDGTEDSTQSETVTHTFEVEDSTRFAVALTVIDNEGTMNTEMKAMTVAPPPEPSMISKGNWEVIDFSSEEPSNDRFASNIIDGDIDTFWHSQYNPERVNHPQFITVDMGGAHDVVAFQFVHREAGNRGGTTRVRDFDLEVSDDGESWETLGEYTLEDTRDPQRVELDSPENFRYFKITTRSSQGDFGEEETLATLAEVSAFQE